MVISRTPFRISFAGGGTDFPDWYTEQGGAVVSATINKYCYLTVRDLPPFFDYNTRLVWSKIEFVSHTAQIMHPAIRGALNFLKIDEPRLQIHHDADLPAQSGTGSSAAFTVGLLHALYALNGKLMTKRQLAQMAITVDRFYAGDIGGTQDQIACAVGGLNRIEFTKGDLMNFEWHPVPLKADALSNLENHLMLFYISRGKTTAAAVETTKLKRLDQSADLLLEQQNLVPICINAISNGDMPVLAACMSRSWALKRQMAEKVSNGNVDALYHKALKAGALGGKLTGAGAGGILAFVVPPDKKSDVKAAMSDLLYIPFRFEHLGSQLIYYSQAEAA